MKLVGTIFLLGLIPLYFLGAAFKLQMMAPEMLIHIGIRFIIGFFLLGVFVFYEQKIKFRSSIYIILALVLSDDIYDYIRDVDSFKFEIIILGAYMLTWGALTGFFFMKQTKKIQ